jgi:hypothetical protein
MAATAKRARMRGEPQPHELPSTRARTSEARATVMLETPAKST